MSDPHMMYLAMRVEPIRSYMTTLQDYEIASQNITVLVRNPYFNKEDHGDSFWALVKTHQAAAIGLKATFDKLWNKYPRHRNALNKIGFPGSKPMTPLSK
mgnify:CR=1 FL=1